MANTQASTFVTARPKSDGPEMKTSSSKLPRKKLLIINPNTTKSMSAGILEMVEAHGASALFDTTIHTATSGVPSINDDVDARRSAEIVIQEISGALSEFDGFLVACYSVHPLVSMIRERVGPAVPVTGIFEASISTAMSLLPPRNQCRPGRGNSEGYETFGIVSTGSYWNSALTKGVMEYRENPKDLENTAYPRFKGVETTGLSAAELHNVDKNVVDRKLKEATKRLIADKDCMVICLGCAGMAGMDAVVREAIVEELGEEEAQYIKIVDGILAGLGWFEGIVRALLDTER